MTYGRSVFKASERRLERFDIDMRRWHELAADRAAWRETLQTGLGGSNLARTGRCAVA